MEKKLSILRIYQLISFTPKALEKFSKSRPTKIEKIENIEL